MSVTKNKKNTQVAVNLLFMNSEINQNTNLHTGYNLCNISHISPPDGQVAHLI